MPARVRVAGLQTSSMKRISGLWFIPCHFDWIGVSAPDGHTGSQYGFPIHAHPQAFSSFQCPCMIQPLVTYHTITLAVWLHFLPFFCRLSPWISPASQTPIAFNRTISSFPSGRLAVHPAQAWMQHHGPCRFLAPWTRRLGFAPLQQEENECNLLFIYECFVKS